MWVFTVDGPGDFPVDMLRYDACWPYDSQAAVNLGIRLDARLMKLRRDHGDPLPSVRLVSEHRAPTEGRWESFLWKVRDVEERRIA